MTQTSMHYTLKKIPKFKEWFKQFNFCEKYFMGQATRGKYLTVLKDTPFEQVFSLEWNVIWLGGLDLPLWGNCDKWQHLYFALIFLWLHFLRQTFILKNRFRFSFPKRRLNAACEHLCCYLHCAWTPCNLFLDQQENNLLV